MAGIEVGMYNTPVPGAAEPVPDHGTTTQAATEPGAGGGGALVGPIGTGSQPSGPPQATRRTTVALTVALVLVVVMSGVLGTVAVLMTRNPDAPPLSTTTLRRLATPLHFAPVDLVGQAPCAGAEAVPDDTGALCYQLEPGVTVTVVQKIESVAEQDGTYSVRVVLAPDTRQQIADLTRETVQRQLAIVVADRVVAAPRVAQEITEDSLSIAGFTQQEATSMLARLNGPAAVSPPAQQQPPPVSSPAAGDPNAPAATPPGTQPGGTTTGQPLVPQAGDTPAGTTTGGTTGAAGNETRYASCRDAIAAGVGPFHKGIHPQYNWYVDKNGNNIACDPGDL
ncbi:hypothetical protein Aph01nite_39160 [Acrocarpospora phusangensis]|uniref:Excalibur calcium-binding domain-containing protein n=1 Tax=Acrocarpospora phusangensis TaxID=1070424 RepID=A0A919UL03_9ACTN|nr:excalibur calcium-binding domain-containing protein [Acrocarpospora phusangensis]GIH25606.1 hypothetical protein Aph01nite_39160 [Acrocarpospora phusangensis]